MRNLIVFIVILLLNPFSLQAQEDPETRLGNWFMYFGNNAFSDRWGLHTEAQYRLYELYEDRNQLLLRIGANYYANKNAMVTAGYAFIKDWAISSPENLVSEEHRIWQQFIGKTEWLNNYQEHRFRLEQRWIDYLGQEDIFTNRFRYRLYWTIPLNSKELKNKTWFIGLYDEIFLNINEAETFNQNRLYGAIGRYITDIANVQVGYMYLSFSSFNLHQIQLSLFFNPRFDRGVKVQG